MGLPYEAPGMQELSAGLVFAEASRLTYAALRSIGGPSSSGHGAGSNHDLGGVGYVGVEHEIGAGAADSSGTESSMSAQNGRPRYALA